MFFLSCKKGNYYLLLILVSHILIIDESENDDSEFTNHELIYTSITRCRVNLIVINFGNKQYDDFFTKPEVKQFFEVTS